jgi:hypothetical protein
MDKGWLSHFSDRMQAFEAGHAPREGKMSVSLKVRVVSGCFHREDSPHAYVLIDRQLASRERQKPQYIFVEHESGPELLIYAALVTAGITLAKSVIELVTEIIKARSEGIRKGDRPSDPVEVIVRRVGEGDQFVEETVLRIGHTDSVSRPELQSKIEAAIKRLAELSVVNTTKGVARRARPKKR